MHTGERVEVILNSFLCRGEAIILRDLVCGGGGEQTSGRHLLEAAETCACKHTNKLGHTLSYNINTYVCMCLLGGHANTGEDFCFYFSIFYTHAVNSWRF